MAEPTLFQIESLAAQLSFEDQCALLEHISRHVRRQAPRVTAKEYVDLRDIYKDRVPNDFDIDAALQEIRSEWLSEIDEMQEPE